MDIERVRVKFLGATVALLLCSQVQAAWLLNGHWPRGGNINEAPALPGRVNVIEAVHQDGELFLKISWCDATVALAADVARQCHSPILVKYTDSPTPNWNEFFLGGLKSPDLLEYHKKISTTSVHGSYHLLYNIIELAELSVMADLKQGHLTGYVKTLRERGRARLMAVDEKAWVLFGTGFAPLDGSTTNYVVVDIISNQLHSLAFPSVKSCTDAYGSSWRLPSAEELKKALPKLIELPAGRLLGHQWLATSSSDTFYDSPMLNKLGMSMEAVFAGDGWTPSSVGSHKLSYEVKSGWNRHLGWLNSSEGEKKFAALCVCDAKRACGF